jgi:hypothetical protein
MTEAELDALVAETQHRLALMQEAVIRFDSGEWDNGIMADIRADDVSFYDAVHKAIADLRSENARLRTALEWALKQAEGNVHHHLIATAITKSLESSK